MNPEELHKSVRRVCGRVVAVGELLWDLLPDGKRLGGAPGNVAHHVRQLGARAALVSRVGRDFQQNILDVLLQTDPGAPTGTAGVQLGADGSPRFEIAPDVAWDHIEATPAALDASANADAVYFGTLAQRAPISRDAISKLLQAARPDALKVLDPNLRDPHWTERILHDSLTQATVVKLSEAELDRCPVRSIDALAARYDLDLVALTRGPHGSLIHARGRWVEHPGVPVQVVDAIGAGDAFTAALIVGLLRGDSLDTLSQRANEVAAFVCTQPGATPTLFEELV